MTLQPLTAISPIDGRYRSQLEELSNYFSEFALIRYRVMVEVEYFIALSENKIFSYPKNKTAALRKIYKEFSLENAQEVKATERITNHDVKAVEYFVKAALRQLGLESQVEWVHFGLTSQDINNTATPLLWKEAITQVYLPALSDLVTHFRMMAGDWADVPMLARTHGQPASPTRLGKEFMVFVERLEGQISLLKDIPYAAKFGGATGNFNAHYVAYPKVDWQQFANNFVKEKLGLHRMQYTTQIEHYDHIAAQFDAMKRINTILLDFCRDIWTYISMDYFKQKIKKDEVGSSAMPHKVNPIDFENAEGNIGIANAIFEHLSAKLPVSRLQRDLTDSTVLRNTGVPVAHTILAIRSIRKGLGKLILHSSKLQEDLDNNWAVVAEGIQTILRREHYPQPYEALKDLTRGGESITQKTIHAFIDGLKIKDALKKELKQITPHNYTGKS